MSDAHLEWHNHFSGGAEVIVRLPYRRLFTEDAATPEDLLLALREALRVLEGDIDRARENRSTTFPPSTAT